MVCLTNRDAQVIRIRFRVSKNNQFGDLQEIKIKAQPNKVF